MKLTVITSEKGELLASVSGHVSELACQLGDPKHYPGREDQPLATVACQPGQVFREIEVADECEKMTVDELHDLLRREYCG